MLINDDFELSLKTGFSYSDSCNFSLQMLSLMTHEGPSIYRFAIFSLPTAMDIYALLASHCKSLNKASKLRVCYFQRERKQS
jgi:hypothetical protein